MNTKLTTVLAMVALALLAVVMPCRAMAQDTDLSKKVIPTLELQDADVRDALKTLFKDVNVGYTIDQDVVGTVTCSLKDVKFEAALQFILKQVKATYRVEGGVYQIILQEQTVNGGNTDNTNTPLPTSQKTIKRIKIRHGDPALIFRLLAGKSQTVAKSYPETSAIANAPSGSGSGGGLGGSNGGNSGNSGFGGSGSNSGLGGSSGGFGSGGGRSGSGGGGF